MNVETIPMSTVEPRPTVESSPPNRARPDRYESFADELLSPVAKVSWRLEAQRLGIAVGLGSLFGGAIGLRRGGTSIVIHALGVPMGLLVVSLIAVPAFAIVLALANAPVDALSLGRATGRAAAKAGLVLGGLAPAAALFVASVEDAITVTIVGFGGRLLAGLIGIGSFASDLRPLLQAAPAATQRLTRAAMPVFLGFATLLAARVWWLALPLLTGAR